MEMFKKTFFSVSQTLVAKELRRGLADWLFSGRLCKKAAETSIDASIKRPNAIAIATAYPLPSLATLFQKG